MYNNYYFDYAAATPLSPAVKAAMEPYEIEQFYNPSAQYLAAKKVRMAIETSRAEVAKILGTKPQEIFFTAGGTEANNMALHGVMQNYPEANCIVSEIEHDSVLAIATSYNHKIAPVDQNGRIIIEQLKKLIDDSTVLVSVMYANNEIGTVQPLNTVGKMLSEIKLQRKKDGNTLPLYLHTDACQAPNYLHVIVNTLGVDLMSLNGGKIYGPKQSGVLYARRDIALIPLMYGGGQESGMRSGTENVPGIIGFTAALKETVSIREQETKRMQALQKYAWNFVTKHMPDVIVTGKSMTLLANNLHLRIPGQDNERFMMELDERGYMVAVGSACSASNDEPSHVLKAIGLTDIEAQSSIRITMGRQTTKNDLLSLLKTISVLINS